MFALMLANKQIFQAYTGNDRRGHFESLISSDAAIKELAGGKGERAICFSGSAHTE